MKILIFNWRDIRNPSSGGAEILTHEIAKRWIKQGHSVTQFSSEFPGCSSEELIDRINIIRKGHPDARYLFRSVHFQAFLYYVKYFRGKFDVVIDEIHGLPFFTPLYVKEKKVALICEVAGEIWYKMYGHVFGFIGRFIEIFYLRFLYRNIHFLTISKSTKDELVKNGIDPANVDILPMGILYPAFKNLSLKEKAPTLIFVGRLSKTKGAEDAIKVIQEVKSEVPEVKLWIIGRGDKEYTNYLKRVIENEGLQECVTFFGYVSEKTKFDLMAKAHVLIAPSMKEGFGLTIPEAGIVETPSVAYNVSGLKDIIASYNNGVLVCPQVNKMAQAVISLLKNKRLYKKVQQGAKEYAQHLNLEQSAEVAFSILSENYEKK